MDATSDQVERQLRIALGLYQEGRYREAIEVATRARGSARLLYGPHHPSSVEGSAILAATYVALGRYQEALELQLEVLGIDRERLGNQHPDIATDLTNLASSYEGLGRYAEAEAILEEALGLAGVDAASRSVVANNLAVVYKRVGRYTDAELLYKQSLRAARAASPVRYGTALNNLGMLYEDMGRYSRGEPLLRKALRVRRETLGQGHPHTTQSLNNVGRICRLRGKLEEAEVLHRQALELRRSSLGATHPDSLQSLTDLGMLHFVRGDYEAARALYLEALEACSASLGHDHPRTAASLKTLAGFYMLAGDFVPAERILEQALAAHGRTAAAVDTLASLGALHRMTGDYEKSLASYRAVLEIRKASVGSGHPLYAACLMEIAEVHAEAGNFAAAEQLMQQALVMRRERLGARAREVAATLNSLATLRYELGFYEDALRLTREALDITRTSLGVDHPNFVASLGILAGLYAEHSDYASAEPLLRQVLEFQQRRLGRGHASTASQLNNLGSVCYKLGRTEEAEGLHRRALGVQESALGHDHPDLAQSLNNLGLLCLSIGRLTEAEATLRRALRIWEAAGYAHPGRAASLVNLALVLVAAGRVDEAAHTLQQAAAVQDELLGQAFAVGSERQRAVFLRQARRFLDLSLTLVVLECSASLGMAGPTLDLVLRRKGLRAEASARQRESIREGRQAHLQSSLHQLAVLRMQLARKTLEGPGASRIADYRKLLDEWSARIDALEAELARESPETRLEHQLRTTDRRAVASRLPLGSALVEFVEYRAYDFKARSGEGVGAWKGPRYAAFVLHAGHPDDVRLIDLGEAGFIDSSIAACRSALTRLPMLLEDTSDDTGVVLRSVVFDPLLAALGGVKRLFVAPDGDLALLPFEALPLEPGRRAIDDFTISYLNVGRDVLRFETPPAAQTEAAFVAADPDFDLVASTNVAPSVPDAWALARAGGVDRRALRSPFQRLEGTRDEGVQVADALGVKPVLGPAVLEATIKSCRSPLVLHIATHGFLLRRTQPGHVNQTRTGTLTESGGSGPLDWFVAADFENPLLRSGLALAGANTWLGGGVLPAAAEDGILTAEDASHLDLVATQLVVLSACETGLGEIEAGQGVLGLRHAFILAGAKTLVLSLWKVPDQETRDLMVDMYRRIGVGEARVDALRNAQLALRSRHRHPYYWAAFVCQGDPRPLGPRSSRSPTGAGAGDALNRPALER